MEGIQYWYSTECHLWVEHTAEVDSEETLDSDEDGYPLLPENVLELRLDRRKAVLRQFMAVARRLYCSDIVLSSMLNNLPRLPQTSWTYTMEWNC